MEIRRNPITGDPVIFAPERAARPNDFGSDAVQSDSICPFCPGNEEQTPPETLRAGDPWRIRAFPNKYPFAPHQEVIVETPLHRGAFRELPNVPELVAVYLDRFRSLASREGVRHVVLFRNDGAQAGASLRHLHSQIAAIDFVPPRIARESRAFRDADRCPLCSNADALIVIDENRFFRALAPHARSFPSETWIVPAAHQNDFGAMAGEEIGDFASILQSTAMRVTAGGTDHNWMLINFRAEGRAHWYLQVGARSTTIAGFELATGTFIDSTREGD